MPNAISVPGRHLAVLCTPMDGWLPELLRSAGPWLLPAIALGALLEYVAPPFPGDAVVIAGTCLALADGVPASSLYLVLGVASVLGPFVSYGIGTQLRSRFGQRPVWSRSMRERFQRAENLYQRWGPWFILGNRFVPVARSLMFVFAGMAHLPLWKTVLLGIPSGLLWNAFLLFVAYELDANAGALLRLMKHVNTTLLVVFLVVTLAAVLIARRIRRRRS